jgi:Uma2 family endonuclease
MSVDVKRRRFTVEEFHWMSRIGILRPDERVELLNGDIITMAAIGSRHAYTVTMLQEWFGRRTGEQAMMRIQQPVVLGFRSEVEPDVSVVRRRADGYITAHPAPEDVLFLVEVSVTTLDYDRGEKLLRYAVAGIQEVWIVDVSGDRVEVYREPTAEGYRSVTVFERGATIAPAALPDAAIPVEEILGRLDV